MHRFKHPHLDALGLQQLINRFDELNLVTVQRHLYFRVDRVDANQFFVYEFLNTQAGEFSTITGVLDAAKRQLRCRPGGLIDEHHTGVDTAGHKLAPFNVLGKNGAAKPEIGIVG